MPPHNHRVGQAVIGSAQVLNRLQKRGDDMQLPDFARRRLVGAAAVACAAILLPTAALAAAGSAARGAGSATSGTTPTAAGMRPACHGYRKIDLGALGGTFSDAAGLNQRGQVVGSSGTAHDDIQGFLWRRGKMTELAPAIFAAATAVNDRGQVAGYADLAGDKFVQPVLWQHGKITSLGRIPGGTSGAAAAINDRGEIVGEMSTTSGAQDSFLWRHGTMTSLGAVTADDINNAGEIVGSAQVGKNQMLVPFVWRHGRITYLPLLRSGYGGVAQVINNKGLIAGFSGTPHGLVAVVWQHGTLISLRTPPALNAIPTGINDKGEVVGTMGVGGSGEPHFFWWRHGKLINLTSRGIPAGGQPIEINDRGQIAGTTAIAGAVRAALWVPCRAG
jgi:probable HAF family extracellular repeat protein